MKGLFVVGGDLEIDKIYQWSCCAVSKGLLTREGLELSSSGSA